LAQTSTGLPAQTCDADYTTQKWVAALIAAAHASLSVSSEYQNKM
jgi:hypothetical protein